MEIEAKFALSGPEEGAEILALPLVAKYRAGDSREIGMESVYYDDEAGCLRKLGFALRLRRENGEGVCCLKRSLGGDAHGVKRRYELECPAPDIGRGIAALIAAGAPEDFREAVRDTVLRPVAHMRFTRTALLLRRGDVTAELAFDRGAFGPGGEVPFAELELEWKSGPEAGYHALLEELTAARPLAEQPLSKLARAIGAERDH